MSDPVKEIREKIQQIAGKRVGCILCWGEVSEITDKDCSVKVGDLKLTKVRLYSQATAAGNIYLKPKEGSMVTVLCDAEYRDLQVISCDSFVSFKFEENGLVFEYDSDTKKFDIKNDQVGLKDLLQSVADIVKQLTVSTPAGPSGTPLPPTLQQVTTFETDFKKLLK